MLNYQDKELLEQARNIIRERFKQGWHHVGAALRTRSGKTFAAVHLEAKTLEPSHRQNSLKT